MKVFLPSNGLMGLVSVELRDPKIGDLRKVPNYSQQSSIIKKTEFVRDLVGDDVWKITPQDRDYLFVLAVGAITLNQLTLVTKCSCGKSIQATVTIGELEPLRLSRAVKNTFEAKIFGFDYTFHKLTVRDEVDIEERAIDLPDEDYDNEFKDGQVAKTLGYPLDDSGIDRVRNLDLSIYMAALLYADCDPHGLSIVKEVECPQCHNIFKTFLPITSNMLVTDVGQIMSRYVSVQKYLSMESYFDITLPEYNLFVLALNKKLAKK